jgi:hypothetical protein
MPKQLTFTAYSYDELLENIKEKVCQKLYDINVDDSFWYKPILEEWKEKLEKMGYQNADINFSGFWSQGDGASFTSKSVDIQQWIRYNKCGKEYRALLSCIAHDSWVDAAITRFSYHYSHENTVHASINPHYVGVNPEVDKRFYDQADNLERSLTADVRSLSREIYRILEKEYSYQTSKEAIEETIEANDYLFHSDGQLISHPCEMQIEMDATI